MSAVLKDTDTQESEDTHLNQDIRVLEAMLFAAEEPLSTQDLHERTGEKIDVGGALLKLKKHYEGRGVVLFESEGMWSFRTASDLSDHLTIERQSERKLSKAAMETLAIIAYHQPVTRAEIENIRGVAVHRGTLDVLVEAGWVSPGRRRNAPGKPLTWITSSGFLNHFSLESLSDLPGLEDMKASGLLDSRPAIEAMPREDDMFSEMEESDSNAYSESDKKAGANPLDDTFEEEAIIL